jgi:ElaB/YqjD/DUF883 family membrane-anchored ribosome-binding protein
MTTESLNHAVDEAKSAAETAGDQGQKAFNEALAVAERTITEAAKKAEKALKESIETLRAQTKIYGETAGQQAEEAQRYVLERVKERPVTATLTGLGVGVLLGLLLSNRGK